MAASGSAMIALSVISRQSRRGSRPVACSARSTTYGEALVGQLAGGDVDRDGQLAAELAAHAAAWRHASSSTQAPIGTIRPVCSAIGMNSGGTTRPRSG